MKIKNILRTMLLTLMIIISYDINAQSYRGTITIEVGEEYIVDINYGSYVTQSGSWSKSNSTFIFVSQGQRNCTIRGNQVGTGTLYYQGFVNGDILYLYWTVNVVSDTKPTLTLSANPAGGEIEKGTKVYLTASQSDANIYYTLNGNTPTSSSTKYTSSGITINESCTLKAIAMKSSYNNSAVMTWVYSVIEPVKIEINATNFPDANFRNYLLEQSYGKDGVLTEEEIKGITRINVSDKNISSLKGIEHFSSLQYLYCDNNQLTSLDVSKNTALTYLKCSSNQLTSLDVSKNTALTYFYCSGNQLTSLDVSKNTALIFLYCYNNQLTALDVSKNTALVHLDCSYNQLTSLDVSKNTALIFLYCYNNQLTALDVSKNTALTYFYCSSNQLISLDVSKNTALTYFYCSSNQLISLDVSKNTALTYLNCYYNQLTSLDVSMNTLLTYLNCQVNKLTELDVSKNTKLTTLVCGNNQIKSLDISKNTLLEMLYCWSNLLTSLDVSNNTALTFVNCHKNNIKEEAMDALINGLPQNMKNDKYELLVYNEYDNTPGNEGNVCTKEQVAAAKAKGWTPEYYNGTEYVEYEGSDDGPAKGTEANPFTPAEAYVYGSTLAANEQSQEDYYIRGMVVSIKEQFSTQYGNATFYISADGTEKDQFYIYRALYLENTKYAGQDQLLRVGDDIVVCGKITNYMGTLPETVQEKAYVVSINGNTSGINDVMIDGNKASSIYNLNGQRVSTTKKGLYIINGKKVVVK